MGSNDHSCIIFILIKVKSFLRFFIYPQKKYLLPCKCDVLIYDLVNAEFIISFVNKWNYGCLAVRGESINLPVLIKAMFQPLFGRGNQFKHI